MLRSFFWMCSGADSELLRDCPGFEQIKYAGVGGTVFFTALMAFIAGSYALHTVFESIPIAIAGGSVWGLLIFNLDRFIVSTMKKQDNKWSEWLQALPRIVLAIIIAVVIAKPLELKIFEREIDRVILSQEHQMLLDDQGEVAALYATERAGLEEQSKDLESRIAQKEAEVNELYDTFIAEAEGREGTLLIGKGPVYAEKRAKHDEALAELRSLKEEATSAQQGISTRLEELKASEAQQLAESQPIIEGYDGLMARVHALDQLPWLPSFFIFLLFLAIETAPVFAKLTSPKGIYDIRYAEQEDTVAVWAEQKQVQRAALLKADMALNKRVYASLQDEEETYHYKKQKARVLIQFQTDAFLEEQKGLVGG